MGACWQEKTLLGSLSKEEVKSEFKEIQARDERDYGQNHYSGSFATCDGYIEVLDKIFDNHNDASDALESGKKRVAQAARFHQISKVATKKPTFGGEEEWGMACRIHTVRANVNGSSKCCRIEYHSTDIVKIPSEEIRYADQLTEKQKERLDKIRQDHDKKRDEYNIARAIFTSIVTRLQDIKIDFADYQKLKAARNRYRRAKIAVEKAADKFREVDAKLAKKLYATKEVDEGVFWLIGAWCAM